MCAYVASNSSLLGQQLVRQVLPVAKAADLALAPGKEGAAGGDSEAVRGSSRQSDDALASQGLDLLRQQLILLVAVGPVAQHARRMAAEADFLKWS